MNTNEPAMNTPKPAFEIHNLAYPIFAAAFIVVLLSAFLNVLPGGIIGALAITLTLGAVLNEIGARAPIVKTYFGGGPIVIIFGSSALVYFGILNERTIRIIDTFMRGGGFLDFVIAALITGSILGMNRKLLMKAFFGYIPAILGAVAVAFGFAYIFGGITGYGAMDSLFMIGIPVMAGGMGAGAVPLSQIYAEQTGASAESMLAIMVPAVALANAMAIIFAGLLDALGKKFPSLTGNGQLMKGFAYTGEGDTIKNIPLSIKNLGIGLLLSVCFYCLGTVIAVIIPGLHPYAWMIIAVGIAKVVSVLPQEVEAACSQWFQFSVNNLTNVILVGIGVAFTDLGDVMAALSPVYLFLVFITVIGAMLGAWIVGALVRFYAIEAIITAGLCMANMGGTGDVATLSAAKRMELMPFTQISSRIGGAIILLLASIMLGIFNYGG